MVCLKQRRTKAFQNRFFTNIGIRIMDKYTWIHVAVCVYMEVPSPASNTSADKFSIVLEIHREQGFPFAIVANPAINHLPLFRIRQQLRCGIIAHRHIMEVPYKVRSFGNHHIVVFFGCDRIVIDAGIAARNTIHEFFLMK